MTMFSTKETEYLNGQRLGRIATVSDQLQPDVSPVVFEFDGEHIFTGGLHNPRTRKYKNVQTNDKVAFVVDDLESIDPWRPRGVRIYGTAQIVERVGMLGKGQYIQITPGVHWSWGLEELALTEDHQTVYKKTTHAG